MDTDIMLKTGTLDNPLGVQCMKFMDISDLNYLMHCIWMKHRFSPHVVVYLRINGDANLKLCVQRLPVEQPAELEELTNMEVGRCIREVASEAALIDAPGLNGAASAWARAECASFIEGGLCNEY